MQRWTYSPKPLRSSIDSPWAFEAHPGFVIASTWREDHTRLFAAAANAMRAAAERLAMDPVDLAEQLEDGKIADLLAPREGIADFLGFARFVLGVVRGHLGGEAEDLGALALWVEGEIERVAAAVLAF
jgi:hypothetical protein